MKLILAAVVCCASLAAQTFAIGSATDQCQGGIPFTLVVSPLPALPTLRYDPLGFTCTFAGSAGPGTYVVKLEFVEQNVTVKGGRVFDVFVNDAPVLSRIDLFISGGTSTGVIVARSSTVITLDGQVTVRLATVVRNAVLSRVTLTPIMSQASMWVYNEAFPIGAQPPAAITLAKPLVAGTQLVYRNGLKQTPGIDYTVAGNVITFTAGNALQQGDNLNIDYRTQ